MQGSMFPEIVPEGEPSVSGVRAPNWVLQDGTWTLLRSHGRTVQDVPQWHHIKAAGAPGSMIAMCGHVGSIVITDVQPGAMLNACNGCLAAPRV